MSRIDNRPRVDRRPPPPKPKAIVARTSDDRTVVVVKQPAPPAVQQGTRARAQGQEAAVAASCGAVPSSPTKSPTTMPPTARPADAARTGVREREALRAQEVQRAVADIHASANAIGAAGDDKDQSRAAALRATSTIESALANKSPTEKRQILDASQQALGDVARGLDTLTGDQTKEALGHLSRAGEGLGRAHIEALTTPMAKALPEMAARHGDNAGELRDGLKAAVTGGSGALFAASLATQTTGELGQGLEGAVADGIGDVRGRFDEAQKAVEQRNGELANVQMNFMSALSPEALEAGGDAFRAEHQGEYAAGAAAAGAAAKVMDGAGLLSTAARDGSARAEADKHLLELPRVSSHDEGRAAVVAALGSQASGGTSFLADAHRAAERIDDAGGRANAHERLDSATLNGASAGINEALANRDPRRAAALAQGAVATSTTTFCDRAWPRWALTCRPCLKVKRYRLIKRGASPPASTAASPASPARRS